MNILNPNFVYTPAAATNILERFRSMGWTPPSELRRAPQEAAPAPEKTVQEKAA